MTFDPPASRHDHKGTTAAGLYWLAEDFVRAAKLTAQDDRSVTGGPARLLALHACELLLKAYLMHGGHDLDSLRIHAHDFEQLRDLAVAAGLKLSSSTSTGLLRATELSEHYRARYVVVQRQGELSVKRLIAMASELHLKVAKALGMQVLA